MRRRVRGDRDAAHNRRLPPRLRGLRARRGRDRGWNPSHQRGERERSSLRPSHLVSRQPERGRDVPTRHPLDDLTRQGSRSRRAIDPPIDRLTPDTRECSERRE
uniref:Uncharacterized protein n=1 Tax=uncultured marine virus TaxID=186617 RepID=A0A0F7L7Y0_9VIRU|nr:hypothetical protein [uncultured marine virus]